VITEIITAMTDPITDTDIISLSKMDSPPMIMKSTKNDCCSKVKIYWVMSTN
jgi:hypothetical protein